MAVIRMLALIMWTLIFGGMALVGTLGWIFSGGQAHGGYAIFMLVVGFGPLVFTIRRYRGIKSRWEGAYAEMLKSAGIQKGVDYEHWQPNSGIAINRRAKTLSLCETGVWKTYAFADVRNWETISATAGRVPAYTGSLVGQTAALSDVVGANRRAAAESGLFVEVRDVERPRWHVMMADRNLQARWMEILRQEINESRPEGQHVHA